MKRLASIGLALVLAFGISSSALAHELEWDGPYVPPSSLTPDDPGVPTDPVFDPLVTGIPTDPVPGDPVSPLDPWWFVAHDPLYAEGVETTGYAPAGTYIGTSPHITYVPAFQYQLIYSDPQGGYSCTAYSAAMAIDRATYGGSRITGSQVRALSGVGPYVGLTLPQVMRATTTVGVPFVRPAAEWEGVVAALHARRGVVLQGDYDQIPDQFSGQPSFDGYHAVYLDRLHSDGVHIYMMDPLSKVGGRWVDASILRRFAEKLTRQEGVYPMVLFAYTRATRLFH
jgi:hypothetical protein